MSFADLQSGIGASLGLGSPIGSGTTLGAGFSSGLSSIFGGAGGVVASALPSYSIGSSSFSGAQNSFIGAGFDGGAIRFSGDHTLQSHAIAIVGVLAMIALVLYLGPKVK